MIEPNAKLSIQRLPLSAITIHQVEPRNPTQVLMYMDKLKAQPGWSPGLLFVTPLKGHVGLFELLDGHHRMYAMLMMGNEDALCVVVEEAAQ